MTEGTRLTYGVCDRAGERAVAATPRGLSSAEAADRLLRDGPNELPRAQNTPTWQTIATQLRDPLILVLMVAATLTLATGDWTDAGVIVLVIVVNTTVGVVQEVKAGQNEDVPANHFGRLKPGFCATLSSGKFRRPKWFAGTSSFWPKVTLSPPTLSWRMPPRCWSMSRR